MRSFFKLIIFIIFLSSSALLVAEKTVITAADQLPRIAYPFTGNVIELFQDAERLQSYIDKAEKEVLRQMEEFDIQDKATVRGYYTSLRTLDILNGDYRAALGKIQKIRELTDKQADKLTSGLSTESLLQAMLEEQVNSEEVKLRRFKSLYEEKVNKLPWEIVQDNIEQTNGAFQYISENLYLGGLENYMQNSVDQNSELTLGDVLSLASSRFMIDMMLPLKESIVEVTSAYIENNRVEKEDIWAARSVDLSKEAGLTPVVVAVWDSGVDAEIFNKTGQMWKNEKEILNGEDDDGNGWIDDI